MNASILTFGHVCLCEWSGPVSVTMVVSLLSHLQHGHEHDRETILILNLHPSSARCIISRSSTFADVLPALWAQCQEIIIACQGEEGLLEHLRRTLCGSTSTPISTLARPLIFFELLDEAFDHAQGVYPHDVLEVRRQRLRSGTWVAGAEEEEKSTKLGNGK